MSTRVIQLDIFQTGFRDDNDAPVVGGSVEFYTADQTYTTPKNGYTTKLKSATLTSVTLDANGAYPNGLFFDGGTVYDFRLKDSTGATVRNYINAKIPNNTENLKTVTTDYTATIDDDVILCDTTSGAITITLYPVEDSVVSITIKNIGSALNSVTIDGDGTDLINGNLTSSLVDGAAQQYFSDLSQWFGAATTTGTAYTSDNLIAGTNVTLDAGSGTTNINVATSSTTVKGVIEIATPAEVVTGTATDLAATPEGVAAALAAVSLGKSFTSTGQTITAGSLLTLPHLMGATPKLVQYTLECTTAEFNYSIGDIVNIDATSQGRSNTALLDATNVSVRLTASTGCFQIGAKTTGLASIITDSSWLLYVSAWA